VDRLVPALILQPLITFDVENEVSKEEFKRLYFKHALPASGWTESYWNSFFEKEAGKKYFFSPPEASTNTQLFIVSDNNSRRMVFLTEDATESLFDHPGKE
jgi:hypothetical protein